MEIIVKDVPGELEDKQIALKCYEIYYIDLDKKLGTKKEP